MDEVVIDFIKTNSYQTKLTEDLRKSLHKETWQDLIEFIDSVKFINWLIQPEEIRGYASDRPKDSNGMVIVDITKPHILKDMDFFRERALYFEKHGRYTHLRPNPNPKSEFAQFWKEELRRWKDGLVRESDGEWISGWHYFYLNYSSNSSRSSEIYVKVFSCWLRGYGYISCINGVSQSSLCVQD